MDCGMLNNRTAGWKEMVMGPGHRCPWSLQYAVVEPKATVVTRERRREATGGERRTILKSIANSLTYGRSFPFDPFIEQGNKNAPKTKYAAK